MNKQRFTILLLALVTASLPAVLWHGVVGQAAAMYRLAEGPSPYFQPEHATLLYLAVPAVVGSACVLFLAPGLLLSLALSGGRNVGQWLLYGLGLSLVIDSVAAGAVQGVMGAPLRGQGFAWVMLGCVVGMAMVLWRKVRGSRDVPWPFEAPNSWLILAATFVGPLLLLACLVPKFFWENMNGDGVHSYEATRLLLFGPVPFWDPSVTTMKGFPSANAFLFAYPASWFMRLFGTFEASARLPYVLYVGVLFAGLAAVIGHARSRLLSVAEVGLLWVQLAVYSVTVIFSASYEPYFADIALPATQDTLLMVCFLGVGLAMLEGSAWWSVLFVVLTFVSLPNGAVLIGLLLMAGLLLWRPLPWRTGVWVAAALLACFAAAAVAPKVFTALGLPPPGREYAEGALLDRLKSPQWRNFYRGVYMVLPGGVLPAAAIVAWFWQDRLSRAITLVTLGYFAFFYIQKNGGVLHYYIPVMLLPLIVFWRLKPVESGRLRPWALTGAAVAGVAALVVCLPGDFRLHTEARVVGSTVDYRIPGYEKMDPVPFAHEAILHEVIPPIWEAKARGTFGGSSLKLFYYSHAARDPSSINYVVQLDSDAPPTGMRLVKSDRGAAVYVKDDAVWQSHLALRPAVSIAQPFKRALPWRIEPSDRPVREGSP